jgi:hypothetical protein
MLDLLLFVGATLAWGALAILLHEATHIVAAESLGRRVVGFDPWGLTVYFGLPLSGPTWRDYAVGAAPMVVGLVATAAALAGAWSLSAPQWIGMLIYTANGGLDDLRIEATMDMPEWWAGVAEHANTR